jgi:sec-independent protein translocase protein TatA
MPRIGIPELVIILVIVLLVFGVGKLPQIGGAIGKSIREFRKSQRGEGEEENTEPKKTVDTQVKQ